MSGFFNRELSTTAYAAKQALNHATATCPWRDSAKPVRGWALVPAAMLNPGD